MKKNNLIIGILLALFVISACGFILSVTSKPSKLGLATSRYEQNLFPFTSSKYDLGTSTNIWNRVFANYASTTAISASGNTYLNTTETTVLSTQTFFGTTTPLSFVSLNNGQADAPVNILRQDPLTSAGYRTALNLISANGTNFFGVDTGPRLDYLISAGTGGLVDVGGTSCALDRPANFISGRCLFWARDSSSGNVNPVGGYDGFGAWLFGASSTEFRNAHVEIQTNTGRFGTELQTGHGNGTATTTDFIIKTTGNVGVGTTTPTDRLSVYSKDGSNRSFNAGGTSGVVRLKDEDGGGWAFGYGFNGSGGTDLGEWGATGANDALTRYYLGTLTTNERISVLSAGNVGIGTTTPGTTLTVNGTITSTSTAPTLSSCGTNPSVIGNNNYGEVTAGAATTACTVTFSTAYPSFASCTVTPQTGSVTNTFSYTVSKSALIATETALGGTKFNYSCSGY